MTTLYTIAADMATETAVLAVAADDTGARYVFVEGQEVSGLDEQYLQQMYDKAPNKPSDAASWLKFALLDTGYTEVTEPVEVEGDISVAVEKASAEVELDFAQQSADPIDPTQPHEFTPLVLGEDEPCGYCDQMPDAEVHQT